MKKYLQDETLFVKDLEKKLIYKIDSFETEGNTSLIYNLELVAGWDYINTDDNDIQGWCSADNFIEEVQYETIIQYFIDESLKESLKENGYSIINTFPKALKEIIDNH